MLQPEKDFTDSDRKFMRAALEQASIALKMEEVPVGCVIVQNGIIVSHGHNRTNITRNGTRHAEMIAIDSLLEQRSNDLQKADFPSCSLYVTCEPCIMCAGALSLLRFKSVIFGCANDKFGGNGSILNIHMISCGTCATDIYRDRSDSGGTYKSVGGLLKEDAIELLQEFYITGNPKAPKPHRPLRPDIVHENEEQVEMP